MQQYRFCVALRLRLVSVPAVLFLALAISAVAQTPNLTDSTSTPLAAAGHDYLGAKLPSDARVFGGTVAEYVNPGSGSLSLAHLRDAAQGAPAFASLLLYL